MFSLFYGLWRHVFSKTEFHVLILGVHKAGKTLILLELVCTFIPTVLNSLHFIGAEIKSSPIFICTRYPARCDLLLNMTMQTLLEKLKSIYLKVEGLPHDRVVPTVGLNIGRIEDADVKLVFWDLGGQHGLRTIWDKYYEEAHAIIYVIDSAAASSFEDAKSALEKVLRHEDLQGAPLLIFANKQDSPAAVTEEELARHMHLKELDERPFMFLAGSAYDGTGIKLGVDWLVEQMERSKRTEMLRARTEAAGKI